MRVRGVVGDMSLRFFDREGRHVASPVEDRVIALTLEQHRAIPLRIAVAGGDSKREALLAAATGGLFNILVTDSETATWLADHT
jgi:dihydroxyacetone kinase-like protein